MALQEYTKFSQITVNTKRNLRQLRLNAGHSMNEGARLLGISRKQLEDIETVRNYGCHIDLEILAKASVIYQTSPDRILGELPGDHQSGFYQRPRKRGSSSHVKTA